MPLDLEDAISEALESAGDALPSPLTDLAGRARRRHRSRRRARVLAAVVVLALVAGVVYTNQAGRPSTPAGPAHFELSGLPLATDQWPDAFRTLPETLPNGTKYSVIAQVDADSYIVQASLGLPSSGAVYEFEPAHDVLRELVAVPASASQPSIPMQAAQMIDDNRYVVVATNAVSSQPTDVYVVSVADRRQVTHVVIPPGDPVPAAFGWYDGHIVWSTDQNGSVGGDPFSGMDRGVYGPENLYLPIAATSTYSISLASSPWMSSSSVVDGKLVFDLWNPQTGLHQRISHTISPTDGKRLYCLPAGCRLSGVQPHFDDVLTVDDKRSTNSFQLTSGRFVVQTFLTSGSADESPAITTVWDLVDDTYVAMPVVPGLSLAEFSETQSQSPAMVILSDDGSHKVILNLAAITD